MVNMDLKITKALMDSGQTELTQTVIQKSLGADTAQEAATAISEHIAVIWKDRR
jgi:hypothetical protein